MSRAKPKPTLKAVKLDAATFITGKASSQQDGKAATKKATFYFEPDFHRKAKAWCAEQGISLSEMAQRAMEEFMKSRG